MDNVIKNAVDYVKRVFENDFSGHDYFHTLRVYKTATRLAESEGANVHVAQLGALLHDVDDVKLSPQTHPNKDNARAFLVQNGVSSEDIERIVSIIDQVSFKGTDSVKPTSLEGECVQDADRLDAIGAIGIARAFAYGGNHNRVMYDPEEKPKLNLSGEEYRTHVSTTINHFYEKLFTLKGLLNTFSAKEIADHRENYMRAFIDEFMDEWDGIK